MKEVIRMKGWIKTLLWILGIPFGCIVMWIAFFPNFDFGGDGVSNTSSSSEYRKLTVPGPGDGWAVIDAHHKKGIRITDSEKLYIQFFRNGEWWKHPRDREVKFSKLRLQGKKSSVQIRWKYYPYDPYDR